MECKMSIQKRGLNHESHKWSLVPETVDTWISFIRKHTPKQLLARQRLESSLDSSYLCSVLLLAGCRVAGFSSAASAFSSTTYLQETSCEVDNFPSSLKERERRLHFNLNSGYDKLHATVGDWGRVQNSHANGFWLMTETWNSSTGLWTRTHPLMHQHLMHLKLDWRKMQEIQWLSTSAKREQRMCMVPEVVTIFTVHTDRISTLWSQKYAKNRREKHKRLSKIPLQTGTLTGLSITKAH